VALVGDVPRGLPSLQVPDVNLLLDHADTIAVAAVGLLLIGFSQTAGDSRMFAARHHYRIDINQESAAQGIANAGAGLFQGMPVSTSLSASSLNDHSGARTGLASLTTGVIVLATLLVLAPVFSVLPKPVLAALIIEAVVMGMMDVPEMRRLARGPALRLLDRGRRDRRDAPGRRARRGDDRDRPVADLADLGGDSPAHARAGTGGRYPGFPGA
jgi:SulP family sulfate permease